MTRKTTIYARKQAQRRHQRARQLVLDRISADVRGLQLDAAIHAWTGADAARITDRGGRICYIVANAANRAGFDAHHPDMRVLRGLANTLADLVTYPAALEQYRPSITAGLAALERLLPHCSQLDLANAAIEMEQQLDAGGIYTNTIETAMGVRAQ